MAPLLECPPEILAGFLDFIAEEELTDGRITAGQHILGLPTPVLGHVNTPTLKAKPSYAAARELLAQWRERAEPARIQILVDEAVATSAIEGITLDPKDAMKAILRRMAVQEGCCEPRSKKASPQERLEPSAGLRRKEMD